MNACAEAEPLVEPYAVPTTGTPAETPVAANDKRQPTITMLGGIALVTPAPIGDLPLPTRQRIDRAELRARAGMKAEASRMILAIEEDLGVTTQDRIDAIKPQDDYELAIDAALKLALASIDVAKVSKPKAKKGKAKAALVHTPAPDLPSLRTDEDLTGDQIAKLGRATAKLASRDGNVRAEGREEIAEVERWHTRRTEALRREAEEAERRELEALRHDNDDSPVIIEEIEVGRWRRDDEGFLELEKGKPVFDAVRATRTRVISRDGLESLATSHLDGDGEVRCHRDGSKMTPAITPIQYAAGMKYRELYEAADPERGLKSCMGDPTGGRSAADPFGERAVAAAVKRAQAGKAVIRAEDVVMRHVAEQWGEKAAGRAIRGLREVAGKGRTMRQIASGKAHAKHVTSLCDGLDALADHFGLH